MAKVNKKKLKDYFQDKRNFNRGTEFGEGLIEKSVSKFGAGRSMLVSNDGVLIAGNKSHQKLAEAGIENVIEVETDGKTAVVVKRTDIKSGTKKFHELALADNATSKANLNFDETLIEEILTEEVMAEWGIGSPQAEEDNYSPPPLEQIRTDIKAGDIFEIGNHKLICGDATDESVWQKLNIPKSFCCFTSPPYNVGLNAKTRGHNASGRDSLYANDSDDLSQDDYIQLLTKSLRNAINFTGGVCFNVQQLAGNKIALHKWLLDFQDYFADIVTWDKMRAAPVIAKGVLSSRFEWLVIFNGEKKSKRTIPLSSWHGTISNIYQGQPKAADENTNKHGATFPIHLPSFIMADLMNRCSGAVDCFMGTGTTMVAGHQLGRNVYGIEIMPQYCQIIIDRMAKLDSTLKFTKNGKPYKAPVESADNETHKPSSNGTNAPTALKEAEING